MKRVTAVLGAASLIVGVWLPFVRYPSETAESLFALAGNAQRIPAAKILALVTLAAALGALPAALLKWRSALGACTLAALAAVLFAVVNVRFGGEHGPSLAWGIWVLAGGVFLLLVAVFLPVPYDYHDDDDDDDDDSDGTAGATQKMVRYQMGEGVIPRATD